MADRRRVSLSAASAVSWSTRCTSLKSLGHSRLGEERRGRLVPGPMRRVPEVTSVHPARIATIELAGRFHTEFALPIRCRHDSPWTRGPRITMSRVGIRRRQMATTDSRQLPRKMLSDFLPHVRPELNCQTEGSSDAALTALVLSSLGRLSARDNWQSLYVRDARRTAPRGRSSCEAAL